jgi:putative transposase
MTRTRYQFFDGDTAPAFLTCTTVNWLPLFCDPSITSIVLDSLAFLIHQERLILYAYVIMENHLHLIASSDHLSREVANFKSFTARKSIDWYIANHNQWILDQLACHKLPHKQDRDYQFWQEGSHPQRIMDARMMGQKIEYIHQNPVRRGYIELPEH